MSPNCLPLDEGLSSNTEVDVIVFPHAGASADGARALLAAAPDWLGLRPVELPGRGRRMHEAAEWSLLPLVRDIAQSLLTIMPRPTLFFGHSMGALLAFETARALPRAQRPHHLLLAGHPGPQLDRAYLKGHEESDEVFAAELRRWGGEDAAWLEDEDLRALFLPVLRADFHALVEYRYQGPHPNLPTMAVRGADDPFLTAENLGAWGEVSGHFEAQVEAGGHFFWQRAPELIVQRLVALAEPLRRPR